MTQTRRQFVFQSAATLAAAGFLPVRAWAAETPVEAETAFGRIRGVDVDGIKTFKAIPYGASTAGRNRFRPPVDPAKWTGVRDALAYGPSAPQREPGTAPNTSDLAVAGAGTGNSPCSQVTVPLPTFIGDATMVVACNHSIPCTEPTMSMIESRAPTSCR